MRVAGGDGSNRVRDGNSTVVRSYEKLKSGVADIGKALKELSQTIESGQEWPVTKVYGWINLFHTALHFVNPYHARVRNTE